MKCYCFSDRKASLSSGWIGRDLLSPPRLTSGHDINRYHKVFAHRIFCDVRYSIYLDGNVIYRGEIKKLLEHFRQSGAALGLFRHPQSHSLRDEADACKFYGKFDRFDKSRVSAQINDYIADGFNVDAPIGGNYFLVRDHAHPLLPEAMSLWWSSLFEFTKRDQMSLTFSLWKIGTPWVFLDDNNAFSGDDVLRLSHRRTLSSLFTSFQRRMKRL